MNHEDWTRHEGQLMPDGMWSFTTPDGLSVLAWSLKADADSPPIPPTFAVSPDGRYARILYIGRQAESLDVDPTMTATGAGNDRASHLRSRN
jgi:hypothetical protein